MIAGAALSAVFSAYSAPVNSIGDLADALDSRGCYADSCTYEVLLASLSEPVTYRIALQSGSVAENDTLAPCDYIVSWELDAPSGVATGFAAYFDGSHFRFRDTRLQEYHDEWNHEPFAPGGNVRKGVQNQAQFTELLPQFLARQLREIASDSTYIYKFAADTVVSGRRSTVVKGIRRTAGYDAGEYVYVFDRESLTPLRIELENNPGQIGEQSIAVTYHEKTPAGSSCTFDMPTLTAAKSEAFEKYRESTFSLEALPGHLLPAIAAPTASGERYAHAKGETFGAPTIIAFLESGVGTTPDVIAAVRNALPVVPMQVNVIWAFLDHRAEEVLPLTGAPRYGEQVLIHAGGAARDCGTGSTTPVLIFTDADGTVRDFIRGDNRELESLVIQKASLSAK